MQCSLENGKIYDTHFVYLLRAPTLILWWGIPVLSFNIVLFSYPWFVNSDGPTRILSAFFIAVLLYCVYLYLERNKYLKRIIYSLSFGDTKVRIRTLAQDCELTLPITLSGVQESVLKRHRITFGGDEQLYKIDTEAGPIYFSSRMDYFEMIKAKLVCV